MSLPISENAKIAAEQTLIKPGMIMVFDNYNLIFGSVGIYEYIRIGMDDLYIGDDWVIGGYRLLNGQSPYITFNTGTTSKISQKLDPSKGAGSSVTGMVVSLVDKNEQISQLISPGYIMEDPLGEPVTILTGFSGTSYPHDYNVIFKGIVHSYEAGTGFVNINLSSSEDKKRYAVQSRTATQLSNKCHFRSAIVQDLFYQNREDITNTVTVQYHAGATLDSEYIIMAGTNINIYIAHLQTKAKRIKELIESTPAANLLVNVKITGNGENAQSATLVNTLATSTTISVYTTENFKTPADNMRTYLKIKDELIEYTSKNTGNFLSCAREQENSNADYYEIDDDIEQVLRITDNPMNIALKIMLSGSEEYYLIDHPIKAIQYIDPLTEIENAIIFDYFDINQLTGITEGDLVTITGDSNPANNLTDVEVLEVGQVGLNSYIILNADLQITPISSAVIKVKCKYNVLGFGLAMKPNEVDIIQHEFIRNTFLAGAELDVFLNDEDNGKEFIERELYLPMACFSVPRKGRSSVAHHVGPFPDYDFVTLDTTNVLNPNGLKIQRSTSENFFNTVSYEYNYDPVTEKYITPVNFNKQTTVKARDKVLKIQSRGLRTTSAAENITTQMGNKLLKRYAIGAEYIKGVKLKFGDSYRLEIGDSVLVDYKSLQITDIKSGSRSGTVRVMEVQNKVLDNKTGEITVDLVNTVYGPNDRFGTISPSSLVGVGSTTSKVILQKSWSTMRWQKESQKYGDYIGQNIVIHNVDWTQVYNSKILGFDNNDPQGMLIDPIATAPLEGWIIQCPSYPFNEDPDLEKYWKTRHAFMCNEASIVANPSASEVELSPTNILYCRPGMLIRIHNAAYTLDSGELTIDSILGNVITLNQPLTFSAINCKADILGFIDSGYSYRVM